ncbi:MAG: DUF4091 domain-containing protein [Kiritimatiellae bacterium]|nr:DUF4091 domain-containing protein [Kiritimatiellia bacterium]
MQESGKHIGRLDFLRLSACAAAAAAWPWDGLSGSAGDEIVRHDAPPRNRRPYGGDERETCFPEWRTDTWPKVHGDGVFLYPGERHVLSGIRLANVRDGVEDYEWLQLAAAKVGRNAVETLIRELARSTTDFSRDPALLRRIRSRVGDMAEAPSGRITAK